MSDHPERIVPWEPLNQVSPEQLPGPSERYPGPWTSHGRGNGHVDLFDAKGRYFAHVYCWDQKDWDALSNALTASAAAKA